MEAAEDELAYVDPAAVDFTQIAPMDPRRLCAFVNFWLCRMTRALDAFVAGSDAALGRLEAKADRLHGRIALAEATINSVYWLRGELSADGGGDEGNKAAALPPPPMSAHTGGGDAETAAGVRPLPAAEPRDTHSGNDDGAQPPVGHAPSEEQGTDMVKASAHPTYAKYFKMTHLGVPSVAVKQKMTLEGVDPDVLDTPDALLPPAASVDDGEGSDASSEASDQSAHSFSS